MSERPSRHVILWKPEWVSHPDYADKIPKNLRTLRYSQNARLIRAAGSSLEHAVALNHLLYEGAYHVLPYLVELLHLGSSEAKAAIYDVLVEIAQSEPHDDAAQIFPDAGQPVSLDVACRTRLLQALPMAWRDLADDNEETVFGAMDLIGFIAPDKERFVKYLRNPNKPFTVRCHRNAHEWLRELT